MNVFMAYLVGFVGLNAAIGVTVLLSRHLSWGFGIAMGVLLGLVLAVLSFKFRSVVLFFCGVYAMAGAVLTAMDVRNYVGARAGGIVEGISVRQAANHPEAGAYRFRDAVLRLDIRGQVQTGHADVQGYRRANWYNVAAVVPSDWKPEEPVTVWAACGELAACRKDWEKPFGAGVRLNPETTSIPDYRKAVAQAESSAGVASAADPVFITWVEDPAAAIAGYKASAMETAKIWNVIWLVTVLTGGLIKFFGKRKAAGRPSPGEPAPH